MANGHLWEPRATRASWRWGLGTVCDKGAKLKEKDPRKREGRQTELPTHLVPRAGPVGVDLRFSYISPGHYL